LPADIPAAEIELYSRAYLRAGTSTPHLTVLTANLKNPFVLLRRESREAIVARLETFAECVDASGADILLLQEVGRTRDFRVDKWLTTHLGFSSCYLRANGDAALLGREEGLAILSRFSLDRPVARLLEGGSWRRPALGVTVHTDLGRVQVITTHLSLRPWRNRRQVPRLRSWVESIAGEKAAIVGGDFNANESASHMVALSAKWIDTFRLVAPHDGGPTHSISLFSHEILRQRLDYLFVRQGSPELLVADCRLLGSGAQRFSDHLAIVGQYALVTSAD
jgi:endonuclease/exonuclease/phosphatase family metal-dependent hydrolase